MNTSPAIQSEAPPAKASLWPYAIMAWFALAITGAVVFVIFIIRQEFDLVRPDYYEAELRHQSQIERVRRTSSLASDASIQFDPRASLVMIRVPSAQAGALTGEVQFYRPSDAKLDFRVALQPDAGGVQTLDAVQLAPGLWKARVEWRAGGAEFFMEETLVIPPKGA